MSSLRKTALSGVYWTFIQQMSNQGISFVVSIILARLLLPEEFGLIALLGVFIAIGGVLVDSGLSQSLIRTENPTDVDYSTIFFFNIIISCLLYAIMFLSAPFIAIFYNQPILINIIRIYCLIFVINSFAVIQNTRLTKDLNFKKQTLLNVPSLIIGSIVGIVMASSGYGVWSLVFSLLTKAIAYTIQLWFWSPWKPTFVFNKISILKHLNFGYKLGISGLINSLFKEIYTIIIGKCFDPTQVGFYNRANTLRQLPVQNLSSILNSVTYPLFSKIQNDDIKLKSVYKKIMQMSIYLISPILLIMSVLAEPLFRFLLTEKWLPSVPYFQILCFIGILYPVNAYNLNVLSVKGYSNLHLKLEIIKKIIAVVVILISFQWGIYGLLYGHVFLSIFALVINSYYSGKYIDYNFTEQLRDILPSILYAIITSIIVYFMDNIYESLNFSDVLRLLLGFLIGFLLFGIITYLFRINSFFELKSILTSRFYSSKRI